MADLTQWASAATIQTGYKSWARFPSHLLGQLVGVPVRPVQFSDIYATTGLVIVKDTSYDGSTGYPISLKTHNPGQVVSSFITNSNATEALAHAVALNIVMNPLMNIPVDYPGAHGDFILGARCYYTAWRIRGLQVSRSTGAILAHVFAGYGVSANGLSITQMLVTDGPTYVLSGPLLVGSTNGDVGWQVEVGFGSPEGAIATATVTAASPEWPAFTSAIPTSDS